MKRDIRVEIVRDGLYHLWVGNALLGSVLRKPMGWKAFPNAFGKQPSRKFWDGATGAARSMWGKSAAAAIAAIEADNRKGVA